MLTELVFTCTAMQMSLSSCATEGQMHLRETYMGTASLLNSASPVMGAGYARLRVKLVSEGI